MKKFFHLTICCVAVSILSQQTLALNKATFLRVAQSVQPQYDQSQVDLYNKFTANIKTNPAVAYETGKAYLAKYEVRDGPDNQHIKYIKRWVASYEKVTPYNQLLQYLKDNKPDEAFASARQVLIDFPDDEVILYALVRVGYAATTVGNEANNPDAVVYARKLIEQVKAGKNPEPTKTKEEVLGNLNYALGLFTRKTQPAEAATYFINAAQFGEAYKQDPNTYLYLADSYEKSEYAGLANQYNTSCKTEVQLKTQECVNLTAKIYQVVDRIIDALARAISYSSTSPVVAKYDKARAVWMETLTKYYKFRNKGSEAGLKELIESVTSKPIPTARQ